jgi:hypothetical protein
LNYFDAHGINVLLQVEPGYADVDKLIDIVLKRYGRHPSVIGFGIDVEWYKNTIDGKPGTAVAATTAQAWEKHVKSYNSKYQLMLKHYDQNYLSTYRGDIIFVDDSQEFPDQTSFLDEMSAFGSHFYPNTVLYQIGYDIDKTWWGKLVDAPATLGQALATRTRQTMGIVWVDFTLRDVLPTN